VLATTLKPNYETRSGSFTRNKANSFPDLSGDPRWLATEKVGNSQGFQRSTRLRDFLFYVVERQLLGLTEEINELNVGLNVYERGSSFNPVEDNIVRVSARQLRAKLREYYDTDGKEDPWIIEIPKGGYVPLFHERQDASLGKAGEENEADAAAPKSDEPQARSSVNKIPIFMRYGAVCAAILIAIGLYLYSPQKIKSVEAQSPDLVTALFKSNPVQVVMSDSALVLMESMLGRRFTLSEYQDQTYREIPPEIASESKSARTWIVLASRRITNIGDVDAAMRIMRSVNAKSGRSAVAVRSARNMNARDFRTGNYILFGDSYSNPWTQMFPEDQFTFRFQSESIHDPPVIIDQNPKGPAPKTYSETANSSGYARIAVVPNITGTGRVLLIAGISMESTESAADFCMNPKSFQLLLNALGVTDSGDIPSFEALLSTSKEDGTGMQSKLISTRRLEPR
jgi:hypothetical protein